VGSARVDITQKQYPIALVGEQHLLIGLRQAEMDKPVSEHYIM
jgi:hypothetical protein